MLKIAMAQMKIVPGHPDKNAVSMLKMISEAKAEGAELIIFPEMAIPGYLLGDLQAIQKEGPEVPKKP